MRANDLRVIKLTGSPRNRGRTHGEELRAEIRELSAAQHDAIARIYGVPAKDYLDAFWAYQKLSGAISAFCPALLDEVRGIAEGAGLPLEAALLLQLSDEEWVFGRTRWAGGYRSKCTAFGLHDAAGGISYAGQNMDIPPFHEGYQTLFHIDYERDGLEALIFGSAGGLGFMGLNNAPLGICCNTLMQLTSANDGLPVAFILRCLLECTSAAQAEALLRTVRHASGQNYLLSTDRGVATFECSADGVAAVAHADQRDWVCHTNHVLAAPVPGRRDGELPPQKLDNSVARLASIAGRVAGLSARPSLEGFRSALSACDDPLHPVSRKLSAASVSDTMSYTAGAAIYELGEHVLLHLAPGPPCETQFRTFDLKKRSPSSG